MDQRWRYLLPAPVRRFPADLVLTVVVSITTVFAVLLPVIQETPIRRVLALPFLLFFPGYALLALLFPEDGDGPVHHDVGSREKTEDREHESEQSSFIPDHDRGIDWVERLALSFGLSIAVIPLLALGITFTPFGLNLIPILFTIAGFTVVCAAGAAYRRWELSPEKRFRVPYRDWLSHAHKTVFNPENRLDALLNIALALSIVIAVVTLVGAMLFPPDGEQYSEFTLLTENDDGDLVAADYPETMALNDSAELIVGIENQEQETVEYTVVIELQRVEPGVNETTILERDEIDRFETTLEYEESWQRTHGFEPTMTGEDLRLQYLLFRDGPPANPTVENSYRDLHIWLDVVDEDG